MTLEANATRVPTAPAEGWSVDTAIDHVLALLAAADKRYEQRFETQEKALELGFANQRTAIDAALAAQKEGIDKAERATEKRFESVNEFRGTLDNQQRTLIPRSEVAVIQDGLNEKIANLTKSQDELRATVAGITNAGRGVRDGWGYAVGVVGIVLSILGVVSAFMALMIRISTAK